MAKIKTVLTESLLAQLGLPVYQPVNTAGFFVSAENVESVNESAKLAAESLIESKKGQEKMHDLQESSEVLTEKTDAQLAAEQEAAIPAPAKPQPEPIKGALNALSEIEDFLQKNAKISSPIPFEEQKVVVETIPFSPEKAAFSLEPALEEPANDLVGHLKWVWVGEGVQSIWQSPYDSAWRLWLNILKAFGLKPEQTRFFDSLTLSREADFEQCVEVLIAAGIERVWVSEEALSSPLVAWLAEGVEIVPVPSLNRMLEEGLAKQQFYEAVINCEAFA